MGARKRYKYRVEEMVVMYTMQHLTYQQIGDRYGMTRANVMKILRGAGVVAKDGEWVECVCDYCGNGVRKRRSEWRKAVRQYCGEECYHKSRENPAYYSWRQGQNIGRQVVGHYYRLEPHNVVHHRDGDNRNNEVGNLVVFENQSEHMKYHHGVSEVEVLWDGGGS